MCALTRQLLIPLSDLLSLSIQCCACHNTVSVDLRTEPCAVAFCPVCRYDYPPPLRLRLLLLGDYLLTLSDCKECSLSFRFPAPPPLADRRD